MYLSGEAWSKFSRERTAMPFIAQSQVSESYDLVVVGSGFGSLFFIHRALALNPSLRILVLERGEQHDHAWQIAQQRNSAIAKDDTFSAAGEKTSWNFTIGYGGGTNCWYAQTPRMHPSDFQTHTLYGVGQDWLVSYDELEAYYCDAEDIMSVSGDDDSSIVYPRSRPYPQAPHVFTTPDEMMKRADPLTHFHMPTARARAALPTRTQCCSSAVCNLCPVDAKFTANNGLKALAERVDILTGANVHRFETAAGSVQRVVYSCQAREESVRGETVVLGANAIHSPAILLRSGFDDAMLGVGINEQYGVEYEAYLDGVDNFDGSTITTGVNLSLYDGAFRAESAGALMYFENRWKFGLRTEPGRWRQTLPLVVALEDPPDAANRVTLDADDQPLVTHHGPSAYAKRGLDHLNSNLERVLSPLPIESIQWRGERSTESHIQSSLRMGTSPANSVVDGDQIHHKTRNLVVVGSSVFPTCPNANPSLTVAALSLRAAQRMFGA